jgi:hypothetical protein
MYEACSFVWENKHFHTESQVLIIDNEGMKFQQGIPF